MQGADPPGDPAVLPAGARGVPGPLADPAALVGAHGDQDADRRLVPVENSRAIRFPTFEPARHVTLQGKFIWRLPVPVAIDCGLSRHVGGLWFQVRERDAHRRIINLFADYYAVDKTSELHAKAILGRLEMSA